MIVTGYNSYAAVRNFAEKLYQRGFGRYQYSSSYKNGHAILKPFDRRQPVFYVIFKRDFFQNFEKECASFCNNNPEYKGVGESINEEALNRSISHSCDYLVFIHSEDVFVIFPMLVKRFCESKGLIRGQRRLNMYVVIGGRLEEEQEITYTFPKSLLKSFDEEFAEVGINA